MALTPPERITLITESAALLDRKDWRTIDLVLSQFSLPTSDFDVPEDHSQYVVQMIQREPDSAIASLHAYLVEEAGGRGGLARSPWSTDKLRLFFSHLAQHKGVVKSVADSLKRYGVEPFVAHESITPSEEWLTVIESGLSDCDAMVVFLHDGFRESAWCDQEVGWAMGRRRPILSLDYGIHSYGFLGKYQDQPCTNVYPGKVAGHVMTWLINTPSLHARLSSGVVDAFVNSGSWEFTRSVIPLLGKFPSISDDDLTRMEAAAAKNIEILHCNILDEYGMEYQSGPEWVEKFVASRRGQV